MNVAKPTEALLWSIAFPGFGQFLNRKWIKGIILLALAFLVNVQAHFNKMMIYSFQGEIEKAIVQTNDQWLMFYPCLYFFSMWDAWKDAGGEERYAFLPFVFAAYFATVGCIYSSNFRPFGILLGPVWLPILSAIPGLAIGFMLRTIIMKRIRKTADP